MNQNYEEAVKLLKENKQYKLLEILEKLDNEKKNKLVKEIVEIDFKQLHKLYNIVNKDTEIMEKKIEHLKYVDKSKLSDEDKEKYDKLGGDIIKNNHYAVVTMAGGQGSRLGHNGPKGTFKLNVKPEPKFLFQILAENLMKTNKKYNITLQWYIMTSTENNEQTEEFFKEHKYFGYPKENIMFFKQGDLPLMFTDGNLILNKNYSIRLASDGNGCIYKSLKQNGILDDMKKRNIKWIFIGSVDNVLLDMCDTALIGLTIEEGNEAAAKSIAKKNPAEKVGVFCKINGQPSIIEYSELPQELAEKRDENGELTFGEANIICHLFTLDALNKIAEEDLPYHVAFKKANYIDNDGNYIEVSEPNAYKFESFVFDAYKFFDNISILRVKREENFAPVKNAKGVDSPDTAVELYNNYNK